MCSLTKSLQSWAEINGQLIEMVSRSSLIGIALPRQQSLLKQALYDGIDKVEVNAPPPRNLDLPDLCV